MKLLHLSDLHLGKRVNEVSILDDQDYILHQILEITVIAACHRITGLVRISHGIQECVE